VLSRIFFPGELIRPTAIYGFFGMCHVLRVYIKVTQHKNGTMFPNQNKVPKSRKNGGNLPESMKKKDDEKYFRGHKAEGKILFYIHGKRGKTES
jgi:hypothetical protein